MTRATTIPQHCCHKPSGNGYVRLNGKFHYTGAWGSEEAEERYQALLAAWLANGRSMPDEDPEASQEAYAVKDLVADYETLTIGCKRMSKNLLGLVLAFVLIAAAALLLVPRLQAAYHQYIGPAGSEGGCQNRNWTSGYVCGTAESNFYICVAGGSSQCKSWCIIQPGGSSVNKGCDDQETDC